MTEVKKYSLELTAAEVNLIGEALGHLPLNKALGLFDKLVLAVKEQNEESVENPKMPVE